jgi:type IV pilus assembly protein PilB
MLDYQTNNGGHITDILVELGFFKEDDIVQELTTHYGFPYLPLANYDIDKEAIKLIPGKIASEYCLIPIDKINNVLMIAMANPLNTHAIDIVETVTDNTVQTFVTSSSDIRRAIKKYYPSL